MDPAREREVCRYSGGTSVIFDVFRSDGGRDRRGNHLRGIRVDALIVDPLGGSLHRLRTGQQVTAASGHDPPPGGGHVRRGCR